MHTRDAHQQQLPSTHSKKTRAPVLDHSRRDRVSIIVLRPDDPQLAETFLGLCTNAFEEPSVSRHQAHFGVPVQPTVEFSSTAIRCEPTSDVLVAFAPPSRCWIFFPTFFQDGVAGPSLRPLVSVKRTSLEQTRTSSIARCLFSTWSLSTPRRARGCQQELSPRTSCRDRAFTSFDALALHDSARFRPSLIIRSFFPAPLRCDSEDWMKWKARPRRHSPRERVTTT